eukprot:11191919-Lingulodinium_polyedra.AAC.1
MGVAQFAMRSASLRNDNTLRAVPEGNARSTTRRGHCNVNSKGCAVKKEQCALGKQVFAVRGGQRAIRNAPMTANEGYT